MRALVEIVIKVFAAYLVFSTVGNYVPLAFVPEAWSVPNSPRIGYLAAGLLVPISIGIVLWLSAPKISKNAFSTETPGPVIPESGIVAAGVFLIGVYWLVRSISVIQGAAGYDFKLFFLSCVVVAGIYGAITASRKILFVQALPGTIGLLLVLLTNH